MKKVLYISYDGLTDPLGQSQVLPYLMKLSKEGYQFTILSFEKKGRFKREAAIIQPIVDKANIQWVPLFFTAKPPVVSKIYDRYRMKKVAISLYKKNRFDLVHCRSYIAAEVGLVLKQKFGTKMLFDMRGFWADEKVDNGQWDMKKWFYRQIYRHYKAKEREFLVRSDGVISLTYAAKNYLLEQSGYKNIDIDVIPCCADLEHFNYERVLPEQSRALKEQLGIPAEARVITYLGSVGGWYMTREMFLFFKKVLQYNRDYVLLVLTKDDPEKVKQESDAYNIPSDKIIITYSERSRLPLYLSLSFCSIFFIRNTFSKIASSPTKHAELMGMGIPVICNDIGDTGWILNQTNTGMLLDSFEEELFDELACEINKVSQIDKQHIRNCAINFFNLSTGADKYASVYKRILMPHYSKQALHAST